MSVTSLKSPFSVYMHLTAKVSVLVYQTNFSPFSHLNEVLLGQGNIMVEYDKGTFLPMVTVVTT